MGVELVGEARGVVVECISGDEVAALWHARERLSGAENAQEVGSLGEVKIAIPLRKKREGRMGHRKQRRGPVMSRKQRGEMAEAAFLARVARLGFLVSKPWGESSRYDLIVDNGRRLLRVQVKSAHRKGGNGGYSFHAYGNATRVYNASEIDLLAAYVVPVDAWYLFPVKEFRKYKAMTLFPGSGKSRSKLEKFRENWGIVR